MKTRAAASRAIGLVSLQYPNEACWEFGGQAAFHKGDASH